MADDCLSKLEEPPLSYFLKIQPISRAGIIINATPQLIRPKIAEPTGDYYRRKRNRLLLQSARYPDTLIEQIYYNFNLGVGDSIDLRNNYRLKVVKIDSITLLDGSKRKRWELSTRLFAVNLYWVEGIGAIDLETLRPPVATISDGANSFSCYFYKNELLYSYPYGVGNNDGLSCAPRLGADPVSTRDVRELSSLQVLQNYGDGQLSFRLEDPGQYQCKLFNAVGALLEQKALSQGNNHFSLTAFPKGVYFLQVFDLKNLQQKTLKLIWQ
ncbi:MAG: T9SS type A sorting domain-containing protein [Haliscomenobacter sp.]|nr:T9SS type A sorting domain-containing protein [Haliscomenobacter sp.]MBK9488777.1 T9SS type A sorting domain-containing protein [Haliscomenobacter sp.]